MRLLANENISRTVIEALRERGHDILSAKESLIGQSDRAILARARNESRVLLTHDRDFGELAFHSGLPAESGIILFRLAEGSPEADNARIIAATESRTDWPGHFSVVTAAHVRMRRLPHS